MGESDGNYMQAIRTYLNKSGYPLEMRVAAEVRRAAWEVEQSRHYVDRETQKVREVDVLAWVRPGLRNPAVELIFVFECKAPKSSWIAFLGDHRYQKRDNELVEAFEWESSGDTTLSPTSLTSIYACPVLFSTEVTAYALQQQRSPNDPETDGPFSAVQQVFSAAEGVKAGLSSKDDRQSELRVIVPVIVTSSHFVTANLDAKGEIELHDTERTLLVSQSRPVWVVQEKGLSAFVDDMRTTADRIGVRGADWEPDNLSGD